MATEMPRGVLLRASAQPDGAPLPSAMAGQLKAQCDTARSVHGVSGDREENWQLTN